MFDEYKAITGLIFIFIGLTFTYFTLKEKLKGGNAYDFAMFFKGIFVGILGLLIGTVMILMHFGLW